MSNIASHVASVRSHTAVSAASLDVAMPTIVAGQLNVIQISGTGGGTAVDPTYDTPAGWNQLLYEFTAAGTPAVATMVLWRIAQAGDPSTVTITWANAGVAEAVASAFQDFDTANPITWFTATLKGASSTDWSLSGTTAGRSGILCYGFANKTNITYSAMSDSLLAEGGNNGSIYQEARYVSSDTLSGASFTKTATGSTATSIGTLWAFVVRDAVDQSPATPPSTDPTVVGTPSETYGTAATSITCSAPTGIQDNELLVAVIHCQASGSTTDYTPPAGWTRRGPAFVASSSPYRILSVFTLPVTDHTTVPTSFTFTNANAGVNRFIITIFRVQNVDIANPVVDATPLSTHPSGDTVQMAALTLAEDALLLTFARTEASSGVPTTIASIAPADTEVVQFTNPTPEVVASTSRSRLSIYQQRVYPGTVTGRLITYSSTSVSAPSGFSLALRTLATSLPANPTPMQRWIADNANGGLISAHRDGSWGTYGEETLEGYQFTANYHGEVSLEISVWQTTDGVYVCSHDQTTARVFSGASADITTSTWASISSKTTLVGGYAIRRLEDILDAFPDRIFMVDNKGGQNNSTLVALMEAHAKGRWYAKGFGTNNSWLKAAGATGVPIWAYIYVADIPNLDTMLTNYSGVIASGAVTMVAFGDYSSSPPGQADTTTVLNWAALHGWYTVAHILGTTTQKATADGYATTAGHPWNGYQLSNVAAILSTSPKGSVRDRVSGVLKAAGRRGWLNGTLAQLRHRARTGGNLR